MDEIVAKRQVDRPTTAALAAATLGVAALVAAVLAVALLRGGRLAQEPLSVGGVGRTKVARRAHATM